jgi:GntR family transcriptional regulator, transcriptional repressor for pyruvate dehydrogenase complex
MPETLSTTRMADEVAQHFRALIQSGELNVGARLPPQRQLAKQLGVGRQAVFEALAMLEAQGYVDTMRGATGGTVVCDLDLPAERWLERLRSSIDDFDDVLDFRIGVERQMAMLAASRRTPDDVQAMNLTITDMAASTDLAGYRAADAGFHRSLAAAARNARLARAAFDARAELFFPVDRLDYQPTVAATVREHTTIVRAVQRGDVHAAARAVTTHLEHTRAKLRSLLDVSPPSPVRRRSKGAA